jgi:hypothetical protein
VLKSSALLMWSTVTLTSFFWPHCFEVPLQVLVLVLQRPGETHRLVRKAAEHRDRERACGAPLEQVAPGQCRALDCGLVLAFHAHLLSS